MRARVVLRSFNSFLMVAAFFLSGCNVSFTSLEYSRGEKAEKAQNYAEAVQHYKRVLLREPESEQAIESARSAARISFFETKKFADAANFYAHLVKFSKVERERREAQQKIANIYFDKLTDYPRAIEEYNKLLLLRNSNEETVDYRFALARAHFNINHFYEAQSEAENALKIAENADKKFELMMFVGSIYYNTKRTDEAISVYEKILVEYPERARKDNVAMNIIVCYEEAELFEKAISKLEEMRGHYGDEEFIELKIKRLKERKANLPGSRGLRK